MKRILLLVPAALLAGCGSFAANSDAPFMTGGQLSIIDNAPVTIVASGPAVGQGGKVVTGTSCKNAVWDPSPSEGNALALMKGQAFRLGYDAVHSVKVERVAGAIFLNCWSAITASGIAFKQTVQPQPAS